MDKFKIGDKVNVYNFMGNIIKRSEVIEVTQAGNVRIKRCRILYRNDGTERRNGLNWTDRTYIRKA